MKIKELIQKGIQDLRNYQVEDMSIKARTLLAYILNKDNRYLLIHGNEEVEKINEIEYMKYIEELIQGKPLQYITHTQEFMGLDFYIDESVLIPQPDTEILVEEAIQVIDRKQKRDHQLSGDNKTEGHRQKENKETTIRILDLCTGSGAIAVSIAKYIQKMKTSILVNPAIIKQNGIGIEVYATDISKGALEIAKKNAKAKEIEIKFILSDMFEELEQYKGYFDVIVSNPPYIKSSTIEVLSKEVQNEPHLALDGGIDGLKFYRMIADEACKYLKEDGEILVEIGYDQKESVIKLFKENKLYSEITCVRDLSGNDRVIKAKKAVFKTV